VAHETNEPTAPSDVLLVLRIVHAGVAATILAYWGLLALVIRPLPADAVVAGAPRRADPSESLTWIFAALAAVALLAIPIVRGRLRPFRAAMLSSWALADAVAVLGLVLGIVHRDMAHFLPFAGLGLAVLLLLAPRRRQP